MAPTPDSILALPYEIHARLRYSSDPDLHLGEHATRADVRRVRRLLPRVRGIGPKKLAVIDAWLREEGDSKRRPKRVPDIEEYVRRLAYRCDRTNPCDSIVRDCYRLVPFIDDLPEADRQRLAKALADMLGRACFSVDAIVRALRGERPARVVRRLKAGPIGEA
jgi:hypothetical protein